MSVGSAGATACGVQELRPIRAGARDVYHDVDGPDVLMCTTIGGTVESTTDGESTADGGA